MPHTIAADYLTRLFGLAGKTAVVIGGTGVLGSAICEALSSAGAYIYVVGNNSVSGNNVIDAVPNAASYFQADATKRADLEDLVRHLEEEGRSCDLLINGAGINAATPFLEIADEDWNRIMEVNLSTVRIACQVFGAYMLKKQTQGSIINIASMSAITPLSRIFAYSCSKAAVLNLTQNLAREWAPHGIRVNALSPGFFPAEQNRKILTEERVSKIMGHTPMNRFGLPEELAGAVLLMASNSAGSFITGSNVIVDGGFSAMTI
ncbi:SDR family oxidoreductase [Planctomicrobium sp. SH668]|uniref:SDR family oxidoreductase n=1 Tax=Planctomicrobium sp. SH668 TaxID=3448126 RepID=UPI003F5C1B18